MALTDEERRIYVESQGYKLHEIIKDKGKLTKIKVECPNFHIYIVSWKSFRRGTRCGECEKNNQRLGLEYVKNFIEIESNSGCKLISDKYINSDNPLELQCVCGEYFKVSFNNFKGTGKSHGQRKCKTCNNFTDWDVDKAREFCNKLGYKLLDDVYINTRTNMTMIDDYGYLYYIRLGNLMSNKQPSKFSTYNPYTIENIKLWCKLNNKSFELLDNQKYKGNNKKLKWKCLKENCGEIFLKTWSDISQNEGCSFCTKYNIGISNCLATINPELAAQWHPTLNGELTPYDITYTSHQKIWWQCPNNSEHVWEATVNSRTQGGNGCPYCSGRFPTKDYNLLVCNPELCKEWNYKRNKKKPEEYCPGSGSKVWWICEKGHEWQSTIYNRNIGNGCPYCSGKLPSKEYNLLVCNPELCKEWDYNKNEKQPEDYTPGSSKKVWWKCEECGHEWETSIHGRNNAGQGCPHCNKSKGEKEISKILRIFNINNIYHYIFPDCKYKNPLEFDFYLPHHIIAIEYQGIQHYEPVDFANKGEEWALKQFNLIQIRDQIKRDYCKNNNIKLIEIPYWDFDKIEEILIRELMIDGK